MTITKTISLLSVALSSTLALTGCPQKDDSSLTAEDYNDIAVGVGSLVSPAGGGGEAGSVSDAVAASTTGAVANFAPAEGTGASISVTRGGLTYEYKVDCFDSADAPLTPCNSTTNRADISLSWTGNFMTPRYEGTVNRTGEWTLSNLQSGTAQLDGTGTFTVTSSFQALERDVTRNMYFNYQAMYDAVQIDVATRKPTGGKAMYAIDGERRVERNGTEVEKMFSVDAEVTFSADGATLVLDGSRTYTISADGTVTPAAGM